MRILAILSIAATLGACSAGPSTEPIGARNDQVIVDNGSFRLEASDYVSAGGILFTLPSVTPAAHAITVSSTQYGSLCYYSLSGDAAVNGHAIAVRVKFMPRLTSCTAEIRALHYDATLSGVASGSYDVSVIHDYGDRVDTLTRRAVVVP